MPRSGETYRSYRRNIAKVLDMRMERYQGKGATAPEPTVFGLKEQMDRKFTLRLYRRLARQAPEVAKELGVA